MAAGGALGLFLGLAAIAIPGNGPIVGARAGFGAGGLVDGGIDAFNAIGLPELGPKRYEGRIREGRIRLAIHCRTEAECTRAKSVKHQANAQAIPSSNDPSDNDPAARRNVARL